MLRARCDILKASDEKYRKTLVMEGVALEFRLKNFFERNTNRVLDGIFHRYAQREEQKGARWQINTNCGITRSCKSRYRAT